MLYVVCCKLCCMRVSCPECRVWVTTNCLSCFLRDGDLGPTEGSSHTPVARYSFELFLKNHFSCISIFQKKNLTLQWIIGVFFVIRNISLYQISNIHISLQTKKLLHLPWDTFYLRNSLLWNSTYLEELYISYKLIIVR